MSSNFKVYRDEDYTTSWITHEHVKEIANYLKGNGFAEIGAVGLGEWMKGVINKGTKDTVVVFAQDVAPDTVFDDIGATALIRQYLDFGGRVVWIGDLPFSYQGKSGAKTVEDLQKVDKNAYRTDLRGASINILSVIPVFLYAPRRSVEITKKGRKGGLKTAWSSLRPIVTDTKIIEFIEPLAKAEALIAMSQIKYDKHGTWNWIARFFSERVHGIDIGKGGIGLEVFEKKEEKNPKLRYFEVYASAWVKNFDRKTKLFKIFNRKKKSGFVRIWDFSPRVITDSMKEELYKVATYGLRR